MGKSWICDPFFSHFFFNLSNAVQRGRYQKKNEIFEIPMITFTYYVCVCVCVHNVLFKFHQWFFLSKLDDY